MATTGTYPVEHPHVVESFAHADAEADADLRERVEACLAHAHDLADLREALRDQGVELDVRGDRAPMRHPLVDLEGK